MTREQYIKYRKNREKQTIFEEYCLERGKTLEEIREFMLAIAYYDYLILADIMHKVIEALDIEFEVYILLNKNNGEIDIY